MVSRVGISLVPCTMNDVLCIQNMEDGEWRMENSEMQSTTCSVGSKSECVCL